ncbi:MAG TPA: hypothetical protein VGI80_05845 [Pyrinomonadaceae bacterium]|jgi:hypothetical protein
MLEFEYCEPEFGPCDCCDAVVTRITRFVSQDEEPYAIYYGHLSESDAERRMLGLISLGEWGSETVPECRVAFAFRLWPGNDKYNVSIFDAAESSWSNAGLVGKKLSREDALAHPWLPEVFHLTDHMAIDDPAIRDFFESESVH